MLEALYPGRPEFKFFLRVEEELPLPIYRERNFGFKIKLVNEAGQLVRNGTPLKLSVAIYTCSNPPRQLETNTSGRAWPATSPRLSDLKAEARLRVADWLGGARETADPRGDLALPERLAVLGGPRGGAAREAREGSGWGRGEAGGGAALHPEPAGGEGQENEVKRSDNLKF